MYNIWFCKIINKDNTEIGGIGGLEYIKVIYEDVYKQDLEKHAKSFCEELPIYSFGGILDNRYCLFKNNTEYCLFFEELLEE